jgi:tetratricopeptide (TPR) repeat protein
MAWKASYLISVREGKVGEALEFWQRYRALSDVSLEQDLIATAIRVTQAAQPTYGLEFLSGLKDLYPDEPAAVFGLGSAAEGYRVYDVAISNLEDASERYKKRWKQNEDDFTAEKLYRESNHLLANAYLKSNQALLGLKRLSPYINENTDDWLMQERFARLEVKAGYFDEAEKRYLRIVENEPKAYTSKLSVALLRLERDDYAGADSLLKDLQGIPQYRSTANYYLGLSAQEQGQLEDAISYYKRINTSDYLVDAKLHIAEIEFSKIGLERTIENLEAIQSDQPEDQVKILRGKAIFYNIAGEKQKAIDEYQQAIDIDDQRADLYLMQSMLYYDLKQFDAYEENLEKALAINPNDVDALNALGYFFVEQGRDLDRAQQLLDKALALAPNRYYVLDSRGWLAYQQGDYETAEAYLKQALSIQMDGEVLLHLIQTEWKLGKKDVAAELWNAHHEKFPENEALQQILQKLSSE